MAPPGETVRFGEESLLVIAPHCDDEVLGCGGLLAERAAAGARVAVLYLSGEEPRRLEAAAAGRELGIAAQRFLGLPDGQLEAHLSEAREAIREALARERPELLLVPSPLEQSADHRAAFTALHSLLTERPDPGATPVAPLVGPTVLAYEVNQPGNPDVLVDVSEQLETVCRAMTCYGSEQARHDYLGAALGLRRFRTLTLPPGVEGAEGYRRLGLEHFRTRSLAELVAELGGQLHGASLIEGPTISVVVRTRDRPDRLREAFASLGASLYRRVEVVLVNDAGSPPAVPEDFPFPVRRVELATRRGPGGAAQAGLEAARGDWIGFLDDDDRILPEHLSTLGALARATDVRAAYTDARVARYALDAREGWRCFEQSVPYSRDFDPDLLLIDNYIPFNSILMERELMLEAGGFDESLPAFEDWDCLIRVSRLARFHHLARVTCEYRHFEGQAHVFGSRPDRGADFAAMKGRVLAKHAALVTPEALSRAVIALRNEAIDRAQRHASHVGALQDALVRARAELATLAPARLSSDAELPAPPPPFSDEAELRRVVDDQADHLRRTYAEIERLNGLLAAATRADETSPRRPQG